MSLFERTSEIGNLTERQLEDALERTLPQYRRMKKTDDREVPGKYRWVAEWEVQADQSYYVELDMSYLGQVDPHEPEATKWGLWIQDDKGAAGVSSITKYHDRDEDRLERRDMQDLVEEAWDHYKSDAGRTASRRTSRLRRKRSRAEVAEPVVGDKYEIEEAFGHFDRLELEKISPVIRKNGTRLVLFVDGKAHPSDVDILEDFLERTGWDPDIRMNSDGTLEVSLYTR